MNFIEMEGTTSLLDKKSISKHVKEMELKSDEIEIKYGLSQKAIDTRIKIAKEAYDLDLDVGYNYDNSEALTAANYSEPDDDFTLFFLEQNKSQIWFPEEIPINDDRPSWENNMSKDEKDAFEMVLGGLTLLDTIQGDIGMNRMVEMVEGHTRKALISFMAMMENTVHAASYSTIFLSLSNIIRIKEIFEWIQEDPNLQFKAKVIEKEYMNMDPEDDVSVFRGMVASTFLESFLFYSGFYYPLYLAGHGKMVNSGEIINLILRDESIN